MRRYHFRPEHTRARTRTASHKQRPTTDELYDAPQVSSVHSTMRSPRSGRDRRRRYRRAGRQPTYTRHGTESGGHRWAHGDRWQRPKAARALHLATWPEVDHPDLPPVRRTINTWSISSDEAARFFSNSAPATQSVCHREEAKERYSAPAGRLRLKPGRGADECRARQRLPSRSG